MIEIYCTTMHQGKDLCDNCGLLLTYALKRIDHCKFNPNKPACKDCPVHCYKPEMREKIRQVMRFAGPRMILTHPVLALDHLFKVHL